MILYYVNVYFKDLSRIY